MRHKVYGKHLGRDKNQRTALFRGLIRSLILHESIRTTQAKAKAIRGIIDRLVVKTKEGTPASMRVVHSFIPQQDVVKKLQEEIAPRYSDRASGFTQVVRLGRRLGDGAMLVRMSLIPPDKKSVVKAPETKKTKESESTNLDLGQEKETDQEKKATKKQLKQRQKG